MFFSCLRQKIVDVVGLLSGVVNLKSGRSQLQNILLKGEENNKISLSATDLEVGICSRMDVEELRDPSSILLPATRLNGILRDDWSEYVSFEIEEEKARIKTSNGTIELIGTYPEDFPSVKELDDSPKIEIEGTDVIDAVEKTIFSTSRGDTRYALNGIFLEIDETFMNFVSSDTHRLSISRKKIKNPKKIKTNCIVVVKGMNELAKICSGCGTVQFQIRENEILVETSTTRLEARLVDGQFPRYRDVIPSYLPKQVTLGREELMKTLRLIGQISNEETHSIDLCIEKDKVEVAVTGGEKGSGKAKINAKTEGGDLIISFNYTYLLELLKVLRWENVVFQFRDSETPARIDEEDYTHVVMPLRIRR